MLWSMLGAIHAVVDAQLSVLWSMLSYLCCGRCWELSMLGAIHAVVDAQLSVLWSMLGAIRAVVDV